MLVVISTPRVRSASKFGAKLMAWNSGMRKLSYEVRACRTKYDYTGYPGYCTSKLWCLRAWAHACGGFNSEGLSDARRAELLIEEGKRDRFYMCLQDTSMPSSKWRFSHDVWPRPLPRLDDWLDMCMSLNETSPSDSLSRACRLRDLILHERHAFGFREDVRIVDSATFLRRLIGEQALSVDGADKPVIDATLERLRQWRGLHGSHSMPKVDSYVSDERLLAVELDDFVKQRAQARLEEWSCRITED